MGSLPSKLVLFTATALMLGAGWFTAYAIQTTQNQKQSTRTIASIKNQSTIMMEKHLMPVTISIFPTAEIPEGPGEAVTVKGQLKTPFDDFGAIHYEWVLAEGVELMKGQLTGEIKDPVAGHVYEIELVLKNFDKQHRKELNLQAYVLDPDGIKLGNSSIITSRPEDSLEHLAPMMMVKAQEAAFDRRPASEIEK